MKFGVFFLLEQPEWKTQERVYADAPHAGDVRGGARVRRRLDRRASLLRDLLSGGRLDFGVGRGYQPGEFGGFGVPISES